MSVAETGALPTSLARYLADGIEEVEGWLSLTTAVMTARLLLCQSAAGLRGDVCEIGVHHGKFFLVIANATVAGERAMAVDVFGDQEKNIDHSGAGNRMIFERHVARHALANSVDIIQASSLDLTQAEFPSDRFRFMSIDGGHTAATVRNDLHLAERTLLAGGVAALDDILSHHWTGVLTGLTRYLADGGALVPLALLPNKLLLSTDSLAAEHYRAVLRQHFPLALAKSNLEFMDALIDSYDDHPGIYLDATKSMRPAPKQHADDDRPIRATDPQTDAVTSYRSLKLSSRLRLLQCLLSRVHHR